MIRVSSRKFYTLILLGCLIFSIYSLSVTLPYFDVHSRFNGVGTPRERPESKERGRKSLLKAGLEIFEILYPSTTLSSETRMRTQNEVDVRTEKRRDDNIADSTIIEHAAASSNQIMSKSYISRPTSLSPRPVTYATKSRFAYVTLLTSTSFLPGTLALSESMYQQGTTADIIVLVLSHVPRSVRKTICGYGFKVIEVEYIRNPNKNMVSSKQKYKFAKLRAWELDEYESIIVLDSDMIVLQNIDELFRLNTTFSAVKNYDSPFSASKIRADPELSDPSRRFNSGLMVIKPSRTVFIDMMSKIHTLRSYNGGDQGFLNEYFKNWTELDTVYNTNKMLFKYGKESFPEINSIKVIHFVRSKPWYSKEDQYEAKAFLRLFDTPEDYEPLNQLWRKYNTSLHKRNPNFSQCERRKDDIQCIKTWWKNYRRLPAALTTFCFQVFPFYCHPSFRSSCRARPTSDNEYLAEDISLVTHLDISRLRRLKQMTLEWSGPISAAIFVKDDMVNAIHALSLFHLPYDRLDIHLVFIEQQSAPYPINLLRNIAMSNSRTDMVLNLDVDFIVSDGLYERLKLDEKYRHVWENTEKKHAFVVPAFEFMKPRPCSHPAYANVEIPILPRTPTSSMPLPPTSNKTQPSVTDSSSSGPSAPFDTQTPCYAFPLSKQQLLPLIQSRHVLPFHPTKKGHSATLNSHWATLSSVQPTINSELKPYYVTWQTSWEPYLIVRKSVPDLPIFNTTFIDRSRNKCVWVFELYVRGFKFVVLPDFWMIHFWEISEGNGDEAIEATRRPNMNNAGNVYTEIVEGERQLWNCEPDEKECGHTERIGMYQVVES